ncbi:hypothetical protein A1O3_06114 [Capronia epimyces CBS 606.96]|uniref:Uncharacterized protein n=1 Tax=Capronia epimyces CBS 606.96 TaxID=1182542 RepID=W9XZ95_9EURO|nr:uncharacterized protein A1O3_06114 [Capronia epimyces CBS 606.96]EXJ82301.1 hypothetical protein A1O3_06114 [Capronia epimyces CBS 606.96]
MKRHKTDSGDPKCQAPPKKSKLPSSPHGSPRFTTWTAAGRGATSSEDPTDADGEESDDVDEDEPMGDAEEAQPAPTPTVSPPMSPRLAAYVNNPYFKRGTPSTPTPGVATWGETFRRTTTSTSASAPASLYPAVASMDEGSVSASFYGFKDPLCLVPGRDVILYGFKDTLCLVPDPDVRFYGTYKFGPLDSTPHWTNIFRAHFNLGEASVPADESGNPGDNLRILGGIGQRHGVIGRRPGGI